MALKIRVEGLRELDRALGQLPRATGKNVLRRVGKKALEPVIENATSKVHVLSGLLQRSLNVSTKLSKRQRRLNRPEVKGKDTIEIYAGAWATKRAHLEEFGTVKTDPHPFLRPAWDAENAGVLRTVKRELAIEIDKAAKRVARKKARALKTRGR